MPSDILAFNHYLPAYLTQEQKIRLVDGLRRFVAGKMPQYFLPASEHHKDALQGDGWTCFEFYDMASDRKRCAAGIILSNSCDIDPNNGRALPTNIVFSPLFKLSRWTILMEKHETDPKRVAEHLRALKRQEITNLFYLPAGGIVSEDHVVRFDLTYTIPFKMHTEKQQNSKLFTLSMLGFYLFLFKISVHFCRLQENVERD